MMNDNPKLPAIKLWQHIPRDLRKTVKDLENAMGGTCYPLYFVTSDGGVLSECAVEQNRKEINSAIRTDDSTGGWQVVGVQINYEDTALYCDHTNERIPSAYAEDDV